MLLLGHDSPCKDQDNHRRERVEEHAEHTQRRAGILHHIVQVGVHDLAEGDDSHIDDAVELAHEGDDVHGEQQAVDLAQWRETGHDDGVGEGPDGAEDEEERDEEVQRGEGPLKVREHVVADGGGPDVLRDGEAHDGEERDQAQTGNGNETGYGATGCA